MKVESALVEMALRGEILRRAAAEVSHDAKNPLHAISIHIGILGERLGSRGEGFPAVEKNLQAMRDQMMKVDAHLKKLARLGAPHVEAHPDAVTAARDAAGFLAHQAKRRGVEVLVEGAARARTRAPQAVVQDLVGLLGLSAMETAEGPVLKLLVEAGAEVVVRAERAGPAAKGSGDEERDRLVALCGRAAKLHGGNVEWSPGRAILSLPAGEHA